MRSPVVLAPADLSPSVTRLSRSPRLFQGPWLLQVSGLYLLILTFRPPKRQLKPSSSMNLSRNGFTHSDRGIDLAGLHSNRCWSTGQMSNSNRSYHAATVEADGPALALFYLYLRSLGLFRLGLTWVQPVGPWLGWGLEAG